MHELVEPSPPPKPDPKVITAADLEIEMSIPIKNMPAAVQEAIETGKTVSVDVKATEETEEIEEDLIHNLRFTAAVVSSFPVSDQPDLRR